MPGGDLFLDALDALAGSRPVIVGGAGGVLYGVVAFGEIDAFAARRLINDPDAFERFRRLFAILDAEEAARLTKQANPKS